MAELLKDTWGYCEIKASIQLSYIYRERELKLMGMQYFHSDPPTSVRPEIVDLQNKP